MSRELRGRMLQATARRGREQTVAHTRAGVLSLADVMRVVERLLEAGRSPDGIERFVASWLRESGRGPEDVPGVMRDVGLLSRRTRGRGDLIGRVDALARRPVWVPPTTVAPRPPQAWQLRNTAWFDRLRASATESRARLRSVSGWVDVPTRFEGAPPVRRFDQVVRPAETYGARLDAPRTFIAPHIVPGVHALQLDAADRLPAGHERAPLGVVLAAIGPGHPLPSEVRSRLRSFFHGLGRDVDVDAVEVHDGAGADRVCRRFRARAFAVGRHIVFRAGAFDPSSAEGVALIAHELTHVWQQAAGRVRARGPDGVVDHSPSLEADAAAVAQRARRAHMASPEHGHEAPRPGVGPTHAATARPPAAQLACDSAAASAREPGTSPTPAAPDGAAARRPAPAQTTQDGLVRETRGFLRSAGLQPSAIFVVADKVYAYDGSFRLQGSYRLSGPVPLAAGFFYDGSVGIERWCALTSARVREITRGRADDLWVVGAQHAGQARPGDPEAAPTRPGAGGAGGAGARAASGAKGAS